LFGLYAFVGLLVLTGGYYHRSEQFHFELAQIDPFAWTILVLWVLRFQMSRKWLSSNESKFANATLQFIQRQPITLLSVGIGLYIAFHFWISSWRYDSFQASAYDLSYVLQSIAGTDRHGFLRASIATGGSYLGEHFSPLLALFTPIYRLWSEAYSLFLAQASLLGLSAVLVYKLARAKKVPREWAVVLGSLFLIYQPLRMANIFDLREDNLFVPVFLGALLALERQRMTLFVLSCVAAWFIKENAGIFTMLLGLWVAGRKKQRHVLVGVSLAVTSLIVLSVVNLYVTPYFSGAGPTMLAKRFGLDAAGIVEASTVRPLQLLEEVWARMIQRENLRYVLKVLTPFVPFAWAAPIPFLIACAGLAMNTALDLKFGFHYECVLIPFLFYVLISGVQTLLSGGVSFFSRRLNPGRPELLMTLVLLFMLFFGRSPAFTVREFRPDERDAFISKVLEQIPPNVSVTAQMIVHPHVCTRTQADLFRGTPPTTDYVVFDLSPWRSQWGVNNLEKVAASLDPAAYQKVIDTDGFLIFKKFAAPGLIDVQ